VTMPWEHSRTAGVLERIAEKASAAGRNSTVARAGRAISAQAQRALRNSYCYRWLTSEPEPATSVVDLRETRTMGPFVRLLETVLKPIERAWTGSGLAAVTAAVGRALARSRTGQLLAALLEPPEPPENEDGDEAE